ncbi:MAG: 23S rRNA (pseudouridine(1915)-N(3))-methyltransferase RlmH [Muribaculaceae bacterium]|nr:23S rRNA (pseudouridine(1915)-N(3))-methyltransferase RlmH [Muribaculaceae bacterium]
MKVTIFAVGKTSAPWIATGIDTYLKRLQHYLPTTLDIIPDVRNAATLSEDMRCRLEGEAMLARFEPSDYVMLLDERGKALSSMEFADTLENLGNRSVRRLALVIGGPYGFSDDVYARANTKLSLSRMTFTHDMARLIIAEQLYRAVSILKGLPYHHE